MAKQLVNPMERHVEKAVLGVAGLLLIGVIARFLVTSPNQLDLGGESVTAPSIDQLVAQKAAAVRERIKRAQHRVEMPEPIYEVFVEELDPFKRARLALTVPAGVAIGPEVPVIDPPERAVGQAELVTVVETGKPAATSGRSTYLFLDPISGEQHIVANWVTISAVLDVKSQMAEQGREYGATRKEIVFGPPQLQRRTRCDDGSWSDDDWKDIEPWTPIATKHPREPSIPLVEEENQIVVPQENMGDLEQFLDLLRGLKMQLDLLRPMMLDIVNGDTWDFPMITSRRDVLMQDDYFLFHDDPPSNDPLDRYRPEGARAAAGATKLTPAERIAQDFEQIEQLLKSASENLSENDAIRAYNLAFNLEKDKDATAADRAKAIRLKERADQTGKDVRRVVLAGGGRSGAGKKDLHGMDESQREPLPIQQIWVHDAAPGSIESGKTYQYRLRPLIYNRLAGQPDKFRDPHNAQVIWATGEWTEPLEMAIEPSTLFFVTSKDERKDMVSVEFFQWFEGIWVKTRERFGVGQRLAAKERCEVPPLDESTGFDTALVTFEADAAVVDVDFARSYRERKRGTSRTGVKFGPVTTACSVVFVDSAGQLRERFVPTDKSDPGKRAAAARVWKPPRED